MSRTTRRQGELDAPTSATPSPIMLGGLTSVTIGPLFWEMLPSGLLDHDLPAWRAYTGQAPFPNSAGWLEAVVHPADLATTRRAWTAALTTGSGISIEHRLRGADGAYRPFLTQAIAELAPDGQMRGWRGVSVDLSASIGVNRDITARRTSERAANDRVAELEAVLETMADAVFVYDAEGSIVRTNAAARALNPFTTDSVYRQTRFSERIAPFAVRDAEGHPLAAKATPVVRILGGELLVGVDSQMQSVAGHTVYLSTSGAPIRDATGAITGAVLVIRDITDRHAQERAAVEQAAEFQAVFDAINDAIFVFNLDGTIRRMNAAAPVIFGMTADAANGGAHSLAERATLLAMTDAHGDPYPHDRWGTPYLLAGGTISSDEGPDMQVRLRDGRTLLLNSSGGPIYDPLGQHIGAVAISRDVTARRQLERRTHDALESLLLMAETLVQRSEDPDTTAANAVARRLTELTCRVLGCQRVSITVIDPATERLIPLGVAGLAPEQEAQWWAEQRALDQRLPDIERTTPDFLLRMRAGDVVTYDFTQPPLNAAPNPYGITIVVVAPMRVGGHLIGWLSLDHGGQIHPYAPDELRLAGAIAQLIALVVERGRLLVERAATQAEVLALAEAKRRMDSFLGIASHELRTPLTSVKANLQLTDRAVDRFLQGHQPADTKLARAQDLLRRTERHLARLDRLIEDLLDVTRIEGVSSR